MNRRQFAFLLVGVLTFGLGCETSPPGVIWSPREGARKISELRNEADACLERFKQSEARALEELECFTEKQYQTTQIQSATDCPLCYLNYGRGLRLLADYNRNHLRALETFLDEARFDEEDALEAKVLEVRERMIEYFTRSTEMFEIYLRAPARHIFDCYLWLADNSQALGDYERAVRYQEDYIRLLGRNVLPAERQSLRRVLRRYQVLRENQRLNDELGVARDPEER